MAFEGIDVNSLKSSLNACRDSINNSISADLVNSLANDNIWLCDSRNILIKALSTLNSKYDDLQAEIGNLLGISATIQAYQNLQAKVNDLQNQYNTLKGKLYYQEHYKEWFTTVDENGNEIEDYNWAVRTLKDFNVENQMNSIQSEINELLAEMRRLEDRVKGSL